jgi:hypothetical protein
LDNPSGDSDNTSYPGGGSGTSPGSPVSTVPVKDGFNEVSEGDGGTLALAFGRHIAAGHGVDIRHDEGPPPQLRAAFLLGVGEWTEAEVVWYAAEPLTAVDLADGDTPGYHFHPGALSTGPTDPVQGIDSYIPDGLTYNKRANVVVLLPEKFSTEQRPDKLRGRYKTCKVWDYEADGTPINFAYSANPADVAMFLVRLLFEQRYEDPSDALAAFQARIDWASYTAWWFYCAAAITWDDGTTVHTIPRFEAHPVFTSTVTLPEALDVCCGLSCTRWQDDGEKIRFLLPTDTDSQHTFTLNNVVSGSVRAVPADVQSAPRHILAKFRDVMDEYFGPPEGASVEVRRDGLIDAYGDRVDVRAFPNMNHSQAKRVATYQMRLETDYYFFVELTAAADSLHLLPGDFTTIALGDAILDGNYLVVEASDNSPESTPDARAFRLQRITGVLYSDDDHGPIQRPVTS